MSSSASAVRDRRGDRAAQPARDRRRAAARSRPSPLVVERPAGEHGGRASPAAGRRGSCSRPCPTRRGDDHVGVVGQRARARGRSRRRPRVDVRERAVRARPRRRASSASASSCERSQNWWPARCAALNVSQARSKRSLAEQLLGERRRSGPGAATKLLAQRQQLARALGAEDLGRVRAAPVAAAKLAPGARRARPARQHDPLAKPQPQTNVPVGARAAGGSRTGRSPASAGRRAPRRSQIAGGAANAVA